jgi:hypothetical protein
MDDTARLVVTVLIAAFVIERVSAAILFFTDPPPEPERRRTIRHFLIAAILGAIAVWLADIRILARLHVKGLAAFDYALSWLVLVAGADRIRDFVGGGGGGEAPPKKELPPIQIFIDGKEQKP